MGAHGRFSFHLMAETRYYVRTSWTGRIASFWHWHRSRKICFLESVELADYGAVNLGVWGRRGYVYMYIRRMASHP